MKKIWKAMICITLALTMMLLTAEPALAATRYTYTVKTASAGTTIKGSNTETYTSQTSTYKVKIYKITVPDDGYITITNYVRDYLILYNSLAEAKAYDKDGSYNNIEIGYYEEGGKAVIPVKKGTTYYIRTYAGGNFKFKYTFKKAPIATSNLYRSKATTLKAGTTKTICVPDGYQAYRWYKIKVSSKRTITINFKDLKGEMEKDYPNFTLFSAGGEQINVVHGSGTAYKSAKRLAAGTYYIRVGSNWEENTYLYTLSWK